MRLPWSLLVFELFLTIFLRHLFRIIHTQTYLLVFNMRFFFHSRLSLSKVIAARHIMNFDLHRRVQIHSGLKVYRRLMIKLIAGVTLPLGVRPCLGSFILQIWLFRIIGRRVETICVQYIVSILLFRLGYVTQLSQLVSILSDLVCGISSLGVDTEVPTLLLELDPFLGS